MSLPISLGSGAHRQGASKVHDAWRNRVAFLRYAGFAVETWRSKTIGVAASPDRSHTAGQHVQLDGAILQLP